jgi:hypothetical protein
MNGRGKAVASEVAAEAWACALLVNRAESALKGGCDVGE